MSFEIQHPWRSVRDGAARRMKPDKHPHRIETVRKESYCLMVRRSTRVRRSESESERKYCSAYLNQVWQREGRLASGIPPPGPAPIRIVTQTLPLSSIAHSPEIAAMTGYPFA